MTPFELTRRDLLTSVAAAGVAGAVAARPGPRHVAVGSSNALAAVALMRQGKSPEAACLAALERGRGRRGRRSFATPAGGTYAVCRAGEVARLLPSAYLFKRPPAC